MANKSMVIERRRWSEVNIDPQRRCYNGVHAKTALVLGSWEYFTRTTKETAEDTLKFWRVLNAEAVKDRGPGATIEFRAVERKV